MTVLRGLGAVIAVVGLAKGIDAGRSWANVPSASARTARESDCRPPEQGFRDLLQAVQAQSRQLAQREAEIDTREKALVAVRKAVADEIARLDAVAKALGITGGATTGVAVSKVFETMRPEEAARILDRLDDATLRMLLGRMRERPLGAILAAMAPERAVAVTKALATGNVPAGSAPAGPAPDRPAR